MRPLGWLLIGAAITAASPVSAEPSEADKAAARHLVAVGDNHLARSEYTQALKAYRGADEIMRVPTTGIEVARTLVLLGRLIEAEQVVARIDAEPPPEGEPAAFASAREKARALASDLEARIAVLRVALQPKVTDAVVTLNGRPLGGEEVRLDPGRYQLVAVAPGHRRVTREVVLAERARERVVVLLEPLAASAPAPRADVSDDSNLMPLAFVGLGLAAAGAIAGGVTGALSLGKVGEAEDLCGGRRTNCPDASRDQVEEAETLAHVSTASFALAGLGAAVGVTVLVVELTGDDPPAETVQAAPPVIGLGLGTLSLRGSF